MPCSAVMQTATCPMDVHALRAREGLLVRREPKSMAERKGVRECVEALNIKRRELEKERERALSGAPPTSHILLRCSFLSPGSTL